MSTDLDTRRIADAEYDRDHQADGMTDDEAAQIAQDSYERAIGMTHD